MKSKGMPRVFFPQILADPDAAPILPIAELAGDYRLLIENHSGVIHYSTEKIGVKMKYGELQICGCHLELQQMTMIKLVIHGQIDSISIVRRIRK